MFEAYISEDPAAVRLLYARPPETVTVFDSGTAESPTWTELGRLPFCKPVSVVQSVENLGEILAPQRNTASCDLMLSENQSCCVLKMGIPVYHLMVFASRIKHIV